MRNEFFCYPEKDLLVVIKTDVLALILPTPFSNAIQIFWFIKKVYVLNDSMKLECIGNVSIYHEVLSYLA